VAGRIIADRYVLSAPERAAGEIAAWGARDLATGAGVRVLLAPHARLDAALRERIARVRHPALPMILAQGEDDGDGYLAVPLSDGTALRRRVAHGGRLGSGPAAALTATLAEAIVAAHRAGLGYGGFDPDRVLLVDGTVPVLADPPLTGPDPSDIAALGVVLAAAVGAEGGIDPDDRPDLSPRFASLVASLTAPVPPSADEALAALRHLVDAELHAETSAPWEPFAPHLAERAEAPPGPSPTPRTTRRVLVAVLAGILALVIGGALGALVAQRGDDATTEVLGPLVTESDGASVEIATEPTSGAVDTTPMDTTGGPDRRAQTVTLLRPRVIDTTGDGENDDDVRRVIDGSIDTGWSTEVYRAADFGAKDGVGLAFDLVAPTRVRSVLVRSRPLGATVRVYVDDGRAPRGGPEGWTAAGPAATLGRPVTRIGVRRAVPATRILIWIEGLPQLPTGGYAVEILGVRVTGVSAGA
jgi:hypothetical protein